MHLVNQMLGNHVLRLELTMAGTGIQFWIEYDNFQIKEDFFDDIPYATKDPRGNSGSSGILEGVVFARFSEVTRNETDIYFGSLLRRLQTTLFFSKWSIFFTKNGQNRKSKRSE